MPFRCFLPLFGIFRILEVLRSCPNRSSHFELGFSMANTLGRWGEVLTAKPEEAAEATELRGLFLFGGTSSTVCMFSFCATFVFKGDYYASLCI